MAKGSKEPARVYVVSGQEAFLKHQAIEDVTARVLGDADRGLALSEYDGSAAATNLASVLDDLRTLPFLSECRLVIVREADPFITRYRAELETYAESPSPTGVLLMECKSLPSNTRLYKRVQACGEVIRCDAPKRAAIEPWLMQRSQEAYGVRLDRRAAGLLRELCGEDLGLLDGELQKLALYVGKRQQVTQADVEALVGQHREEQVWGILSALASGDESSALGLWEEVWQTDRAAPARAIGGIAFTVRRLLAARIAQENGASMQELGRTLMIWNDDARLRRELAAFSVGQIEEMLCRLCEADVAAKTGGLSVRSSIEAFIVDMCRARTGGTRAGRRATG
jgi:DNA polymerase-3 subunit delta